MTSASSFTTPLRRTSAHRRPRGRPLRGRAQARRRNSRCRPRPSLRRMSSRRRSGLRRDGRFRGSGGYRGRRSRRGRPGWRPDAAPHRRSYQDDGRQRPGGHARRPGGSPDGPPLPSVAAPIRPRGMTAFLPLVAQLSYSEARLPCGHAGNARSRRAPPLLGGARARRYGPAHDCLAASSRVSTPASTLSSQSLVSAPTNSVARPDLLCRDDRPGIRSHVAARRCHPG